jgi:cell division protein FtsB
MIALLLALFVGLQYRLWVGEGSFADIVRLQREIEQQQVENQRLQERNRVLAFEVKELKSGLDSVEERARSEMGMIRRGETFFMVVDD